MKKRLFLLGIVSFLLTGLVSSIVQADQNKETEETFSERVTNTYGLSYIENTMVEGVIHKDGTRIMLTVKGLFLPIRKLFGPDVKEIAWDNKRKVAFIRQGGKELVLNFSEQEWQATEDQIVLPKEWIRFENGTTKISAPFLAYVFDRYAWSEQGRNKEGDEWRERLSFLGIQDVDALASPKDRTLHLVILYKEE